MRKVRALIFDFDGLILNTEQPIYRSWLEVYQAYGRDLPLSQWVTIVGSSNADAVFSPEADLKRLAGGVPWESVLSQRLSREEELVRSEQALPGVHAVLDAGQRLGLKIGLASSSGRAWVVRHLKRLDLLAYFDCIRTQEDVQRTKPDPELFLEALACLGATASEAVVFEDSPNGMRAAKAAGIFTVGVPTEITRPYVDGLADLQLGSLAEMELEEILRAVEERGTGSGGLGTKRL